MMLWKRSAILTLFTVLLLSMVGVISTQAQGYFYRFTTPLPTVTCTPDGSSFLIDLGPGVTIAYDLPTPPAAITRAYNNFNGTWVFGGADPAPVLSGAGTRVVTALGSFDVPRLPWTIAFRVETLINNQVIYRSTLTLTCSGVGSGSASVSNGSVGNGSAIDDGRINPENYAPVALYCNANVLTVYGISAAGQGTLAWNFDFSKASTDMPLMNQMNITLSKTQQGRYYLLTPQQDGKQYLFIFDGCPNPGATETYISDPTTGQFVRTE